jgi:L-lactate utilization protein LutB
LIFYCLEKRNFYLDIQKPREQYKTLLAEKLVNELTNHNFDACYCETKAAAVKKVLEWVPAGSTVAFGGSATLRELGLRDVLKTDDYSVLDPDDAQGGAAKAEIARQSMLSDVYLMSANAISLTGEIVNLDGIGNRVAALGFGPKSVIIIAGLNKVTPSLETAIERAKTVAAHQTLLLFNQQYPTYDALMEAAEKSYSHLVVTGMSILKGRIKVLLVGENLGF